MSLSFNVDSLSISFFVFILTFKLFQGRLSHVSAAINDTLLYLDGVNVSTQQQEAKLNLIEIEVRSLLVNKTT